MRQVMTRHKAAYRALIILKDNALTPTWSLYRNKRLRSAPGARHCSVRFCKPMNYHADGRTQTFLCYLTDILTVDTDALRLSVMETTHEKDDTAEPSLGSRLIASLARTSRCTRIPMTIWRSF